MIVTADDGNDAWLTGRPSLANLLCSLWIGSVGLLVLGLQPILLGAVFSEGRVTFDELAIAATLEIIALGIGSAVAALLVSSRHLRAKAAALLLLVCALNHATGLSQGAEGFIAVRTLCGFLEGGLVAVATELIVRSRHPERIGGLFVSLQTGAQCVLAALMALLVIPAWGAAGGFDLLALVCLVSLAAVAWLPPHYGAIPAGLVATGKGALGRQALLALLAIFSFFLFIGAIWAFLEPIGLRSGIPAQTVGLMVSASLAAQVAGAGLATYTAERIDGRLAVAAATLVGVAVAAVFASAPSAPLFWLAALATGFVWLFITPYQIGLTISADASRTTTLLVPAAQLFGAALGPVCATVFIRGEDVGNVPIFAGGCALASLALLAAFSLLPGQRLPFAPEAER